MSGPGFPTKFQPITPEAVEVFKAVQKEVLIDVKSESFELIRYATQVVQGERFFFLVQFDRELSIVHVFRNLDQKVTLDHCQKLEIE